MKHRIITVRSAGVFGAATLLVLAISMAGGCASNGGNNNQAARSANATEEEEARCRAAIADVSRHCSGENVSASRCDDAKSRSRAACI